MSNLADLQKELAQTIGRFHYDPLAYVLFNFPWGQANTVLENSEGPRTWQRELLIAWGEEIRARDFDGIIPVNPIELRVSSGHGIGKSALVAWAIKFIHDTRPHSHGIVTANTSEQLKTKTWAELGKWHKLSLTSNWSEYFASRGNMALVNKTSPETWRVDAQTCREQESESFAGLHAATSTPFYIFDEASAVPDKIWEVSDGGLTDGEPMRLCFGNPTRNTGRFSDYFGTGKLRHRAKTWQIDSRTVEGTNKAYLQQQIDDFGEDSDYVRVRVRGLFPVSGDIQFISNDRIFGAQNRETKADQHEPVLVGVDVARFGSNKSVIRARHGRDARSFEKRTFARNDTVRLSNEVIDYCRELEIQGYKIGAVFVDGVGVGGGVVDQLKAFSKYKIIEVQASENAQNEREYADKRTECYGRLRDWLRGGCIDKKDTMLESELMGIEYGFIKKGNKTPIRITPKDHENSPDDADALALTFAEPIQTNSRYPIQGDGIVTETDDPFACLYG